MSRKRPGRRVLKLAAIILMVYLAWLAAAWLLQNRLMFPRHFAGPATDTPPPGVSLRWHDIGDGDRVEVWLALPPDATADDPAPLVVFFHGNAELIEHQIDLIRAMTEHGVGMLLVEYRGYGRSGGVPTERALIADARAVVDEVAALPEVDGDRIVYHGRSLGGGVAAGLAAVRPPAALILESTFTSASSMAGRYLVPPPLVRSPMRTDRVLRGFDGPVLILHGRADGIVPFSHGERLARIAPDATLITRDRGHNDLVLDWGWYTGALREFLDETVR